MRFLLLVFLTLPLVVGACRQTPSSPMKPVVTVAELMQGVVDPAADVVWGAVGTIVTEQGVQEIFPRNDEQWGVVRTNAMILAESGNLLMVEGRARDRAEWITMSRALAQAGAVAVKAAEARDADAILAVGEQVYDACNACHRKYWPTPTE
jgi:cytochrome c5